MLDVKSVSKSYGSLKAVNRLSFKVSPGEIFGLLGLNGAGKTTTFRMLLNLFEPDEGNIQFNGHPISLSDAPEIGFLSEERSLLTKITVHDQLEYYGRLKELDKETLETAIDYWLDRFEMTDTKHKKIKELSKGNQQKIQFISAILHNPSLLILDEPFTGLDPINVELFKTIILEFKAKGAMIIFSSHRMEHVEEFCEKLVILVKGSSILEGYLKEIKSSFSTKNIKLVSDITTDELQNISGVVEIETLPNERIIKVEDESVVPSVFDKLQNQLVTHFEVMAPSLNEIFISKVGERYENE